MTAATSRFGAGVAMLLALIGGCTDGGEVEHDPMPTLPGPVLSDEQAFARIPLGGTAGSPLSWESPAAGDPELAGAVLTVRRFRALDYHTNTSSNGTDSYLYRWVATERAMEVRYPDGLPGPGGSFSRPARGPVWIWVVGTERSSRGVVVHTCEDRGWRGTAAGGPAHLPRANRAFLWHFEAVKRRAGDGTERWLVDRVWADLDLLGPDARRDCEEWAVHEPGDDA
jgi:hypothetical protein